MRRILAERNLRLTRSLGQNFLHDGNQLRRIIDAAQLEPGEAVLEIGPGLGPLTRRLVDARARVMAIEKDERLFSVLRESFPPVPPPGSIEWIHADALVWLKTQPRDWSEWKLVANLPYSVASPILVELALTPHPPRRMVATLQLDVVRRITAAPGSSDYGLLTLLLGLHFEATGSFRIPPGCFFPEPDVDSACVTLVRRPEQPGHRALQPAFERLVRAGFGQRRKMAAKLLGAVCPPPAIAGAMAAVGIPATARAEEIPRDAWLALAGHLVGMDSFDGSPGAQKSIDSPPSKPSIRKS